MFEAAAKGVMSDLTAMDQYRQLLSAESFWEDKTSLLH